MSFLYEIRIYYACIVFYSILFCIFVAVKYNIKYLQNENISLHQSRT